MRAEDEIRIECRKPAGRMLFNLTAEASSDEALVRGCAKLIAGLCAIHKLDKDEMQKAITEALQ